MGGRGFTVSIREEEDEDEVGARTFVDLEDEGGHRTRIGVEFFNSKVYKQSYDALDLIRTSCRGLKFDGAKEGRGSPALLRRF